MTRAHPIFLDANATTQPLPAVIEAVTRSLGEAWGNPSSTHRRGIEARRTVELARDALAALVSCQPDEIVFTSGGTEAIDLAMRGGTAMASRIAPERRRILIGATEHAAVRACADALSDEGWTVDVVPVLGSGVLDLHALDVLLARHGHEVAMLALMHVNNETGVVHPIADAAARVREAGGLVLVDAVQSIGRIPFAFDALPIDFAIVSAHKMHGPKGVGALIVRRGVRLAPRVLGGPQERQRRGGTESVPAIVGLGAAAEAARAWLASDEPARCRARHERFESLARARVPTIVVNGIEGPRAWTTSSLGLPGHDAQLLVMALSERGIDVSAGAACASGSIEPSPPLAAMGIDEAVVEGTIRIGFSRLTTDSEIEVAIEALAAIAAGADRAGAERRPTA